MRQRDEAQPGDEHPSATELTAREEVLARAEIESSMLAARLRGREASLAAQRAALDERAAWIEGLAAGLQRWADKAEVALGDTLTGLGGGAAAQEADVDSYVQRSATLALARAAMVATREELMARRRSQQERREREVEALEAALVRADVRLTAREKLLAVALREVEAKAAATGMASVRPPALLVTPASEGTFSPADRIGRCRLRLGKTRLSRGAIEVDAASRTLLASVDASPQVGSTVELEGEAEDGPLALPVIVRRVLPAGAEGQHAVVLAPSGWSQQDWRRLERLVVAL